MADIRRKSGYRKWGNMDEVRTPCAHRGGAEVVASTVTSAGGDPIQFCICSVCRRFWLERDGWLLSRREAVQVLRTWPLQEHQLGAIAR